MKGYIATILYPSSLSCMILNTKVSLYVIDGQRFPSPRKTVKKDSKKKSHTSSELSIIKGFLFRGRLTDHSTLYEQETGTE